MLQIKMTIHSNGSIETTSSLPLTIKDGDTECPQGVRKPSPIFDPRAHGLFVNAEAVACERRFFLHSDFSKKQADYRDWFKNLGVRSLHCSRVVGGDMGLGAYHTLSLEVTKQTFHEKPQLAASTCASRTTSFQAWSLPCSAASLGVPAQGATGSNWLALQQRLHRRGRRLCRSRRRATQVFFLVCRIWRGAVAKRMVFWDTKMSQGAEDGKRVTAQSEEVLNAWCS